MPPNRKAVWNSCPNGFSNDQKSGAKYLCNGAKIVYTTGFVCYFSTSPLLYAQPGHLFTVEVFFGLRRVHFNGFVFHSHGLAFKAAGVLN